MKPFGEDEKECWFSEKLPQKHSADVYDLCWFRDGTGLVTASVDNSAIVWDVAKGKQQQRFKCILMLNSGRA